MTAPVLQPLPVPAPAQGVDLNNFLQEWFVALSGLAGALVRPAPQTTPPNLPPNAIVWMAFNAQVQQSDEFPFTGMVGSGNDSQYQLQRNELIRVLCSFYDQGIDGQANKYASLVRDNLFIPQNLEVLYNVNMGLVHCDALVAVPSLLKERWLYRVDLPVFITRQVVRNYNVPSILTAEGQIQSDNGVVTPFQTPVENN